MTKEQEAQQVQAIADIQKYSIAKVKEKDLLADDYGWLVKYSDHKLIIDSLAHKIAEQAQIIATNAAYAIELHGKISEQAKEIERLKDEFAVAHEIISYNPMKLTKE